MPRFHRDFVREVGALPLDPDHLQQVGPRLHVRIAIPSRLASLYEEAGTKIPAPIEGYALLDTGASMTAVDEATLQQLGLASIGVTPVLTPSTTERIEANNYACLLSFPNCPLPDLDPCTVVGATLAGQGYLALLGRDFLRQVVFIYDGPGARITFAW